MNEPDIGAEGMDEESAEKRRQLTDVSDTATSSPDPSGNNEDERKRNITEKIQRHHRRLMVSLNDEIADSESCRFDTMKVIARAYDVPKGIAESCKTMLDLLDVLERMGKISAGDYEFLINDIFKPSSYQDQRVIENIKETQSTIQGLQRQLHSVTKPKPKNPADEIYEGRKQELRHALAYHYWTNHESMPLSPLMPEVDDKLTKFYTALKMKKVDTMSVQKPDSVMVNAQSVQKPDCVDTYKALFYKCNNPYRNIYIQGEAGIGKSTFCTKLGLVWSEKILHECSKESSISESNVKPKRIKGQVFSDENILHEFDFVFSLALRNVQGECEIEEMIESQIISRLPNCSEYDKLVPVILKKERCLIIMDGLDECRIPGFKPYHKSWGNTAVLTTTRPWKIYDMRLKNSEISILIQITGITDTRTFVKNVLNCLNEKGNNNRDAKDFITDPRVKKMEHVLHIPIVALQLIWLWHSGIDDIGDSKCKIYIHMLDMLFGRAQEKSTAACDDLADNQKTGLPPCFESTEFCEQHKMLLDCVGSLAFQTLCMSKEEDPSESIVKSHIKSTAARKTILATGILSQHKSPSGNLRRSHFSFLHKTFQEFLAAYYIATHANEPENILQTLFQVYGQTVDILDISELFIFVCGLNSEMSSKISDSVMKSFSAKLTKHIEDIHVSGGGYRVVSMTRSLQEMILAGYEESISNGHQDPQLALHHMTYDVYRRIPVYKDKLVDRNIDKMVTLCVGAAWISKSKYTLDVKKIQQILTHSSSTLSHVILQNVEGLTGACLDLFSNTTLKSLYLDSIYNQFDVKLNNSGLLYCHLGSINEEVEHSVLSALRAAPQLHTLEVDNGDTDNKDKLCQVLPTLPMLHGLYVYDEEIPYDLCEVLATLSQLQRLTVDGHERDCEDPSLLCEAPSTLSNLRYIEIRNTNLYDNEILLPNSIQEIVLRYAKLTCSSIRQLVDRLIEIPHQVTCELTLNEEECTGGLDDRDLFDEDSDEDWFEEWGAIVEHMQQSNMFEIERNTINSLHITKVTPGKQVSNWPTCILDFPTMMVRF